METLAALKYYILIILLFDFSLSAQSQCRCFTATAGWTAATGGPVPAAEVGWDYCAIQEYSYRTGGCGFANPATNGGFTFAVIDTNASTNPVWMSQYTNGNSGQFGNFHCASSPTDHAGFDFNISGNPWPHLIDTFIDQIPDGCIIIMYSVNKPPYTTLWMLDSNLVNKLAAMGATDLRLLCDSNNVAHLPAGPYIFWTQKGNPNWSGQAMKSNYDSALIANFCFPATTTANDPDLILSDNFGVYPNPSDNNRSFSISTQEGGLVDFYDAIGRLVHSEKLFPGINSVKLDTKDNLVFYKAELSNGTKVNGKMVLTR